MTGRNGWKGLERALLGAALVLILQPGQADAQARLFGSTGGLGGVQYYETAVRKMQKDGEVFFGVDGYGTQPGSNSKIPFRALFNCGNRSKVGVIIDSVIRNTYPIQEKAKNEGTMAGIWYSLQSYHCPDNHHIRSPNELWN